MFIGKVIGTTVASAKLAEFRGVKLLIVQPMDENMRDRGKPLVACDTVQAGPGETVLLVKGREATFPLPEALNPSDATIIGIVDAVE